MKIVHNYKPYEIHKRARYYQTGKKYGIDKETGLLAWNKIIVETTVIGEDDTAYIEKLVEHRCCDTKEPDYRETVLLPLGFHKSRLLKWLEPQYIQLEIFK